MIMALRLYKKMIIFFCSHTINEKWLWSEFCLKISWNKKRKGGKKEEIEEMKQVLKILFIFNLNDVCYRGYYPILYNCWMNGIFHNKK